MQVMFPVLSPPSPDEHHSDWLGRVWDDGIFHQVFAWRLHWATYKGDDGIFHQVFAWRLHWATYNYTSKVTNYTLQPHYMS